MSLNEIYEGVKNHLLPQKDEKAFIEYISKERMSICETCSEHSSKHATIRLDIHCTNCGCTLITKTKCLTCECPLKKWGAAIIPTENAKTT